MGDFIRGGGVVPWEGEGKRGQKLPKGFKKEKL